MHYFLDVEVAAVVNQAFAASANSQAFLAFAVPARALGMQGVVDEGPIQAAGLLQCPALFQGFQDAPEALGDFEGHKQGQGRASQPHEKLRHALALALR